MTVKFKIRVSKKSTDGDLVPIYVRVLDGRTFDKTEKTQLLVNPNMWDPKGECIKSRVLCPDEDRKRIHTSLTEIRNYIYNSYMDDMGKSESMPDNWLELAVRKYYNMQGKVPVKKTSHQKFNFDSLYDTFLDSRELCEGRRRHYEVLRRMIHRYTSYVKYSQNKKRFVFDVTKVDAQILEHLFDYIQNEHRYIEQYPQILEDYPETRSMAERGSNYMNGVFKELRALFNWCYKTNIISTFPFEGFQMPNEQYGSPVYLTLEDVQKIAETDFSAKPDLEKQRDIFVFHCNIGCRVGDLIRLKKQDIINGAVEYIPTKTIKETARTVVVPLNSVAQSVVDKYKDMPGDKLLPFISAQKYNDSIKEVLTYAGITYLVTELDTVTRKEKKTPINEIASSHMARRTFIGNIYKLVKDPNLVSALTGHVEGSRAFNRYRTIDIDMKKDLVKILENRK